MICAKGHSQRIFNNVLWNDIDDYNESDTSILKHSKYEIDLYDCPTNQTNKNSCIFYAKQKYDKTGKLIELIKGDNILENRIDYIVIYKKLSDSVFESKVTYPPNSTLIPEEIYIDSIIKGKSKKICLYAKDKNNYITIRSEYKIDANNEIDDIKRYDTKNNLIQIFYPYLKPKRKLTDSLSTNDRNNITATEIFEKTIVISSTISDKKNRIVESSHISFNLENTYKSGSRNIFVYDDHNQLIKKLTLDEDNEFVAEEKYTYENRVMRHYTRQEKFDDSVMNEEKRFDETGKVVFSQSHPNFSKKIIAWKYYYNERGLSAKDEYYVNGVLNSTRVYEYK
jgi:hypothetical protein